MKEENLIVFSLALGSVGLYGVFMPNVSEVSINYQTPDEKNLLRMSEAIGTAHLLVVAGITSYLAKTPIPIYLAILLGATIFATYEYAMAQVASDKEGG